MLSLRSAAVCLALTLPLALSACGGDDTTAEKDGKAPAATDAGSPSSGGSEESTEESGGAATMADAGPGVCIDAATEHLGGDTKVMEIVSFFSAGQLDPQMIDPENTPEAGTMTTCTVNYQNPDDTKKVLAITMDVDTGEFDEPVPVELSVSGDASTFRLDDYVVALSKVDTAPLAELLEQQAKQLDGAYSEWVWTGIRVEAPGAFSDVPLLRADVQGRIKANDLVETGYMNMALDSSKALNTEYLVP